ncbi:MAG: hypothetical protein KBG75_12190 [Pseudomonadales bacterium]|nr:hypothetical protein [Pseudomonadales bacterium]
MRTLKLRLLVFLAIAMPVLAHAESIVVVVNPGSGVDTLSRNEVINIFLGSFRQLPSGIAALPIDLPPGHPARAEFYRLLVGKNPAEINTYWARLIFSGKTRPPIQAQQVEDAMSMVQGSIGAITYLERSKVSGRLKIVFELAQ